MSAAVSKYLSGQIHVHFTYTRAISQAFTKHYASFAIDLSWFFDRTSLKENQVAGFAFAPSIQAYPLFDQEILAHLSPKDDNGVTWLKQLLALLLEMLRNDHQFAAATVKEPFFPVRGLTT